MRQIVGYFAENKTKGKNMAKGKGKILWLRKQS